jgi:hypothetical protein
VAQAVQSRMGRLRTEVPKSKWHAAWKNKLRGPDGRTDFPRTRTQVLSFCEQHVAANRCRNVLPQPLRIPRGSCVGFPGCRVFTNAEPILKATYFRFASGLAFSNMGLVPKPLQRCEGGRVVFSERLEPTAIADCQASAAGAADQTSRP